jgi:NADH-quinone oxidoreductase subunit M
MAEAAVLNWVLFLPLVGVAALAVVPADNGRLVRALSLVVMVVQLALTAWLYARFDPSVGGLQFETRLPWIAAWGVSYQIGLDGYNILLVLMTAYLGPLVVAGAFTAIAKDVKLFYAMVFLVQFAMIGTFLAQDLFLFYVFWETMLIPMFLLIGIWGGERRIYATLKFVLYTAFGSILMLAAVIYLVWSLQKTTGITSFAFADLVQTHLPLDVQTILLAAFALSFAIKVPMAPLHTWLPDAHVEAPTAGSVILAGVMLKMGTYGFMKLGFPLFPDATRQLAPVLMSLAVLSIVYGACLALVQDDIKKIIAYSSISHLGYVMLGLLSLDLLGIQGAVIQMVSHGLVAGGLFLMVGMIYERCHSRELAAYGGIAKLLPVYSVFFMLLTLASVGLPTTSGFTGEFLVLPRRVQGGVAAARRRQRPAARPRARRRHRRRPRRALHAALRARLPVRHGARAPPAARRPRRARALDPRADRRRGVRARPLPAGADEEDRARRQGVPRAHRHAAPDGESAMNTTAVLDRDAARAPAARRPRPRDRPRDRRQRPPCLARGRLRRRRRRAIAAAQLSLDGYAAAPFAGQFSVDRTTLLVKAMVLAFALPVLVMARDDFAGGEFPALLLSSLYGVCLLQSADSFATVFLGLELMSLPVYVLILLAWRRRRAPRRRSSTSSSAAPRRRCS